MNQFIKAILFVLAAVAGPAGVQAQDIASDMDFVGVKALRITASPLNVYSIDCNIEGTYLMRELQRQFEAEGLPSAATDETLAVISILSSRDSGGGACNSSVMLGAYKKASFFDDDAGWLRTGYVVIWQSALLIASPAETHLALSRDALSRLGEAMLKEWRKVNAPGASASSASTPRQ